MMSLGRCKLYMSLVKIWARSAAVLVPLCSGLKWAISVILFETTDNLSRPFDTGRLLRYKLPRRVGWLGRRE